MRRYPITHWFDYNPYDADVQAMPCTSAGPNPMCT